jgi:putative transcriptional regulator
MPISDMFIIMESILSIYRAMAAVVKNRLEEFRKLRGIRQEDLAADLEVSRQTIGSLENGRYNPSIILAILIARYFGVPVEEMFIYEDD